MSNLKDRYLLELTNSAVKILNKDDLTKQDIQFIIFYRNELKRAEFRPVFDRVIEYFNKIRQVLGSSPEEVNKDECI